MVPLLARISCLPLLDLRPRVFQRLGGSFEGGAFLGPEFELDVLDDTGAADDGRHADAHVADAVRAADHARDGQDAAPIENDAVDDFAGRDADGPAGAAFARDDFGAAFLRALENLILESRRDAGELRQR